MTISMYVASGPVFVRGLSNLKEILDRAEIFARERNLDESVLLNARLFPDMFDLTRQVQIASEFGQRAMARLSGREVPSVAGNERSFAELKALIDAAIAVIEAVPQAEVDGSEDREISLQAGPDTLHFSGLSYLLDFALPNFFFHLTTAYAILRHNGVALGKRDFLGAN